MVNYVNMKIFKFIPWEEDKLTTEHIANLGDWESITAYCYTIAERDYSLHNAYICDKTSHDITAWLTSSKLPKLNRP